LTRKNIRKYPNRKGVFEMTKQTTAITTPEEKPTADLLLRRFKLMDEIVESVRKANLDAGLDPKHMGEFIQWPQLFQNTRYNRWLSAVTNLKKYGKFWQVST
jgi:hypothetical protein